MIERDVSGVGQRGQTKMGRRPDAMFIIADAGQTRSHGGTGRKMGIPERFKGE